MVDSGAHPPAEDGTLVRMAVRGGPDAQAAYGELVRRHQTAVFNVCYRLLGQRGDAEDAAQEAFIRAFDRLGQFDTARPFGPWIRRVAANHCLNRLAARRPESVALDEERDRAPELGPEAAQEQAEQHRRLRAALVSLPPHYRAVIELRHFQDLSYDEIASALHLPLSDVKSHLFRARKLLAEKLQGQRQSL